jgi:hypothetical protein
VLPTLPGLTIDGLSPNTSYVVDLWSLDFINNAGSVSTWYDMSSGSATQFGSQITNSTTVLPLSNSDYHTSGTILTDAAGRFSLGASFTLGSGQLNGITVSTVPVPESGTMAIVLSLGLLMTGRCRK